MELDRYIDGLALQSEGAFRRRGRASFRSRAGATGRGAAVDVGAVIAFVDEISAQEREDVLDSVQLAQRAATGEHNRFSDTEPWYGKFIEVMERVGWNPTAFGWIRHNQKAGELEMDAKALGIVEAIATGGALTALKEAMATMRGLAKADRPITVFERHATTDDSGNFQIGEVRKEDKVLTIAMGAFRYQAEDRRIGTIFGQWGANRVAFWSSAQRMTFDTDQYAKVRDMVKVKLGDPIAYVADLGELA